MKEYNYYFEIADVLININIPFKFTIQDESKNFVIKDECVINYKKDNIIVKFIQIDSPLIIKGKLVYNEIINIYNIKNKFIHELYPAPGIKPYAWLIPINKSYYEIKYLKGKEKYFAYSRNILEAISIERILNKNNAFLLHCSFIKSNGKAILFSAPSGTGKSTQAELWKKYENADIINGDKAGVRKVEGRWMAYGLPFAGSSNIFRNEKAPISHIIVLKQGKQNKLKKLSPREAFIKIYSETTIHTWDSEFQENIINMITDLVQEIPVYLYECLPDKSAVDFLKSTIEGDEK